METKRQVVSVHLVANFLPVQPFRNAGKKVPCRTQFARKRYILSGPLTRIRLSDAHYNGQPQEGQAVAPGATVAPQSGQVIAAG